MAIGEPSIERQISDSMFNSPKEKTLVDKILGTKNAERVVELIKKSPLTREDLNELHSYTASTEQKLLNLDNYNRYVILKFHVWLTDFVKIAQTFYDYQDYLKKNDGICSTCSKKIEECKCFPTDDGVKLRNLLNNYNYQISIFSTKIKGLKMIPDIMIRKPKVQITKYYETIFENTRLTMEHNVKSLGILYFNVIRTSLSVNAAGFNSILANKFEVDYKNNSTTISSYNDQFNQQQQKGIFRQ